MNYSSALSGIRGARSVDDMIAVDQGAAVGFALGVISKAQYGILLDLIDRRTVQLRPTKRGL